MRMYMAGPVSVSPRPPSPPDGVPGCAPSGPQFGWRRSARARVAFAELLGAAWALFYYNPRPRDVKRAAPGPGRRILLGRGGRRPRPGVSRPWPRCPRFPAPLPPRNFPDSYNSSTKAGPYRGWDWDSD